MDELLATERGFAELIAAHEECNKHAPDSWKPVPGDLVRGHWQSIENILAYARGHGLALPPGPVMRYLEAQAGYLARGIVPRSILEARKPGKQYGPQQEWEIGLAVSYLLLARAGKFDDNSPVSTIRKKFNVSRETVQMWVEKYPPSKAECTYGEFLELLDEAARRYKVAGRPGSSVQSV